MAEGMLTKIEKLGRPPAQLGGSRGPRVRRLQLRETHAVQHQQRHLQVQMLQPVRLPHHRVWVVPILNDHLCVWS